MTKSAVKDQKRAGPGWKAADFRLRGTDGKDWTLAAARGPNGLVVIFMCNHCPYVKGALDRIVKDMGDLKALGVGSLAVMANDTDNYPDDSFDNMKKLAEAKSFPFPYVIDETQDVARAYDAVCTPEFYGFNSSMELAYHGRLDAAGRNPLPPGGKRELYEAMRTVAQGGQPPAHQEASVGCTIKWKH
ncbi:MAG TPA: thioredoxin family protein [Alphaproteobacteria bacterium]|nr:thioredoxin family protein [Alphaproteobacteria bacterium]